MANPTLNGPPPLSVLISPSQHKKEMVERLAEKFVVPNSTSGSVEEEENDDEKRRNDGTTQEGAAHDQECFSRSALSFGSLTPSKYLKLTTPFSPKRTAAEVISTTKADEDFERDSRVSQSSSTTARLLHHEKIALVDTTFKDETTPAEISDRIHEIATNVMALSTAYEEIDPEDKPFGDFELNQRKLRPGLCSPQQ
jgi:hypothetical protein